MDVSIDDLLQLKVKELKSFLRSRGEQVTGSKSELLKRAKGAISIKKQPLRDIKDNDQNLDNQRLVDKLRSPLGEKLPDPSTITLWDKEVSLIPSVSDNTLYDFLVLNANRTHDAKQANAKRQLNAKVFYEDRHVHSVLYSNITDNCSHCFIKCKVLPSLPTDTVSKKPDYNVWVCLSKVTGRVHSASCTCTAGKGESCNHISALLYALVDITAKKIDGTISSTSELCKWNQPRKRKLSPKKSQDLTFTKHSLSSASKENVNLVKTTEDIATKVKPVNVQNFKRKLLQCNPSAAWLKLFKPSDTKQQKQKAELPKLHNIDKQFHNNVDISSDTYVQSFVDYFGTLEITQEASNTIEELSRGQHGNDNWKFARQGRITSSNFGSLCKRLATTAPDNLVKTLLYAKPFDNEATRWGREHEPAARRQYMNRMSKTHGNIIVKHSGLIVNPMYPHFCASPDGLVSCEHCEEPDGLLEIKCPFKFCFTTPDEAAQETNFCCELVDGELKLKENHPYFYQIQGQMAVCGLPWCDFVVWTCKGMNIQRIDYDYNFWEKCMMPGLTKFYIHGIIPELFTSRIRRVKDCTTK